MEALKVVIVQGRHGTFALQVCVLRLVHSVVNAFCVRGAGSAVRPLDRLPCGRLPEWRTLGSGILT